MRGARAALPGSGRPLGIAGGDGDGEVAERFRQGDPAAVARVRRWVAGAAGPFRGRLGAELEDVEGEVLLALTEALGSGRFEGRSSFATYVRRTTLHKCLNRVRHERRWQTVPADDLDLAAAGPGPEHEARSREAVRASLRVVARMSAACRHLWTLLHRGHTYGEMSALLGVAPGTLRVRVLRCRRQAMAEWHRATGAPEVTAGGPG